MFKVYSRRELERKSRLLASMHLTRTSQFVDRHNWSVRLNDQGLEVDEFDDMHSYYAISSFRDVHLASVRIRPMSLGSLLEKSFSHLMHDLPSNPAEIEITRLCVNGQLAPHLRAEGMTEMLLGLCRHFQKTHVQNFVGIVFPSIARVARATGWPPEVISKGEYDGKTVWLCRWQPGPDVEAAMKRIAALRKARTATPQISQPIAA